MQQIANNLWQKYRFGAPSTLSAARQNLESNLCVRMETWQGAWFQFAEYLRGI